MGLDFVLYIWMLRNVAYLYLVISKPLLLLLLLFWCKIYAPAISMVTMSYSYMIYLGIIYLIIFQRGGWNWIKGISLSIWTEEVMMVQVTMLPRTQLVHFILWVGQFSLWSDCSASSLFYSFINKIWADTCRV